jgi:hypothetical protein
MSDVSLWRVLIVDDEPDSLSLVYDTVIAS